MTLSIDKNPDPLFPEDLLAPDRCGTSGEVWWIAHVKSRREKTLAGYLASRNIGYYLPLARRRQPGVGRTRYSLLPLFPGYVFINTDETGRHTALRSNQIARLIQAPDPAPLVRELRQIHQALSSGLPVFPADFLHAGRRVRVINGSLKGVEGMVLRADKHCRLILSVTSIMQSISLQLDADMVEPV